MNVNAIVLWALLGAAGFLIWGDVWHTVAGIAAGFAVSLIAGALSR